MKIWAAVAALGALACAVVGVGLMGIRAQLHAEDATASLAKAEREAKPAAPTSSASVASVTSAASEPQPVALDSLPAVLRFRQTNTYNGNVVYVPEDCRGPYDVILHFHGAHPYVKEAIEKADIRAVVTVFNSGNGAERYAQVFQAGGMLSSLMRQIEMATTPLCPGADAKPRRIALTAWSAGYAAIEKLLARPEARERIDAVLLADGLHAAFTDRWKRRFAPNALLAFREFGALAKANKKLFAITHSSIATDEYASTSECSKLLLQALDIPSEGELVSGRAGGFSIEGSAGVDAAAHVAQFRQMDASLLSKLRARWSG
jgi:hypothetical protein